MGEFVTTTSSLGSFFWILSSWLPLTCILVRHTGWLTMLTPHCLITNRCLKLREKFIHQPRAEKKSWWGEYRPLIVMEQARTQEEGGGRGRGWPIKLKKTYDEEDIVFSSDTLSEIFLHIFLLDWIISNCMRCFVSWAWMKFKSFHFNYTLVLC